MDEENLFRNIRNRGGVRGGLLTFFPPRVGCPFCEEKGHPQFMDTMGTTKFSEEDPALPPVGKHVVVHCSKFSCLGYRDNDGTWKNVFTHQVLTDVLYFSPVS